MSAMDEPATSLSAAPDMLLTELFLKELTQPVPQEADIVAAEIQRRHGQAVDGVLFYGSCLRTQQMTDAVLDFYVLVRSYRAAYEKPMLRWLNALLPPNVFYLEMGHGPQTLRAKYAVISTADFEQATTPRSIPAIIWARFCQPARLVYARDSVVQERVAQATAQAALTFIRRAVLFFASPAGDLPISCVDLWHTGFRETYRTEFRTERPETIRALYKASPERYDQIARLGLQRLEQQHVFHLQKQGGQWTVFMPLFQRWTRRCGWTMRRFLAKVLYALRLLKTALTFGDWLPYVLWKLGRHTGVWVELSERQRRYPLIWGWPVLFKLLRQRALR